LIVIDHIEEFRSTGANSQQITDLLDSIGVHGDTRSFRFGLRPIDGRAQRHDGVHDEVREEYWRDIHEKPQCSSKRTA
jgi:hypothetical protein